MAGTLFMLSLTALIDHVKEKKVKISPDQIPTNIHKYLWENSTVVDLIINTCHPLTRDWFSNHVIRPPVMSVDFLNRGYGYFGYFDRCAISIQFENREVTEWELKSTQWTDDRIGPVVVIRTGNQYLSSVIHDDETRTIISTLPHYDRTKFEVINWLCKVFHYEINDLELRDDRDELMMKWPKLELAKTLKIHRAYDCEGFLMKVVERRQEKRLRTTLESLEFRNPVQKELLKSIDFTTAHLNFTNLKVKELIEVFQDLSKRECRSIDATTVDLTSEDLETFKSELKLVNFFDMPETSQRRRLPSGFAPFFQHFKAFDGRFYNTFFSWQEEKVTEFEFKKMASLNHFDTIVMTVR